MTVGHADGEQHERARRAAERAARLVEELTRARIDVELFERQRRRSPLPGSAGVVPGMRGPRRRPTRVTLGFWLITLYLLVTMLAQAPPNATDSTVYQPRALLELTTAPAPADGVRAQRFCPRTGLARRPCLPSDPGGSVGGRAEQG